MSDSERGRPAGQIGLSREQQGHATDTAESEREASAEPDADLLTPSREAAGSGSQLGAASGIESLGTAGAPTRQTAGTEKIVEVDPEAEGSSEEVATTRTRSEVGPTHPSGGFSTTRSTGGIVQHPTDVHTISPVPLEAVEDQPDDTERRDARP